MVVLVDNVEDDMLLDVVEPVVVLVLAEDVELVPVVVVNVVVVSVEVVLVELVVSLVVVVVEVTELVVRLDAVAVE